MLGDSVWDLHPLHHVAPCQVFISSSRTLLSAHLHNTDASERDPWPRLGWCAADEEAVELRRGLGVSRRPLQLWWLRPSWRFEPRCASLTFPDVSFDTYFLQLIFASLVFLHTPLSLDLLHPGVETVSQMFIYACVLSFIQLQSGNHTGLMNTEDGLINTVAFTHRCWNPHIISHCFMAS